MTVFTSSHSKFRIHHSFVSRDCNNKTHNSTISARSSSEKLTSNKCCTERNLPPLFGVDLGTLEPLNIQQPKTSQQTKGIIRVSGIMHDYSEDELIKMASPFGNPVDILKASQIDTQTGLEWKKVLLSLPTQSSAQEMVKVYSAIPVHLRQHTLELVSQMVDFNSPVSVFHAFVGPSISNGLLAPLERLIVVSNIPNQPCAATGLLKLLKPFGLMSQVLVFTENKVNGDQCLWNKSRTVQMVLEMETTSVASSVYEWSQKVPCVYHNHHLSFLRGCDE